MEDLDVKHFTLGLSTFAERGQGREEEILLREALFTSTSFVVTSIILHFLTKQIKEIKYVHI